MKGRKILSAIIAGAMVLGTMSFPVFAENTDNSLIEVSNSNMLKAAVNNIAENGTIKFTDEITVTKDGGNDPGVITFTKNCTVDLNGQTLNTGEMQWFAGSAAVTFTSGADNGKIKFGDVADSLFRPDENGSFSIENITFTQTEDAEVCYLFQMAGENSSINLKNCVLDNINTASYGGVICGNNRENTKASIENCQITNINGVAVFGGQVTVKNSTISATTPFKIARDNHYAVLSGQTTITGGNYYNNGNKIYTIGEDVTVDSQIPTTVPAATIGTTPYATLADALAAAQDGDVVINLETDATLQLPDYYANLVNDDVTSLTINGNSHTLDVDATYRLKFNMAGTLKLNNVTVKSDYLEANTWDSWDFLFNCDVEFTNVIFNREMALEKNAVLTGVTINNSSTDDSYAIWIPATQKTVVMDNVTINAAGTGKRGIKIDEQYINEENIGVVNLTVKNSTFNTHKKSAILVKSKAGANIVASNNNIENVNADTTNLVWVDSDLPASYPKVKVTIDEEPVAPYLEDAGTGVACIGNSYYMTLADAVAAAQDGDVIDLIGNTVQLNGQTKIDKDITIINGTFDITDAFCTTEGIIYIYDSSVAFNNVDLTGSNFTSAFGVIYANHNADVTLDNCDFTLQNDLAPLGGTLKGNDSASFTVKNCTFDLENPSRVLTNIKLDMSDTTINAYVTDQTRAAGVLNNHAFRNVYGEIKNSTINVTGTETGIKNTAGGELKVSGNSAVTFSSTVNANIYLSDANETLTVEPSANVIGDIVYGTVSESVLTDKITVNFVPTADENVYDIVLDGNYKEIYEFVGAELQFVNESKTLSNADMLYTIEAADDINVVEAAYGQFGFYIKDGATTNRITANKIILGKVVFGQQGNIKFSIKQDGNNSVQTTQYRTHLEEEYKPNVVDGLELVINSEKSSINSTVEAATRDVLVNVNYAHALDGTHWTDNKITVTLKDAFGVTSDAKNISDGEEAFADVPVGRITVTLKAPGFRTFTYTTTVEEGTDPLVLSFWNDTKRDTAQSPLKAIEAGKAPIANNFVVGDIAMDYIVDKYDLAAVTSYYGTYNLTDENKIRYDLNRDGSIDITDVAYVLHNFGF